MFLQGAVVYLAAFGEQSFNKKPAGCFQRVYEATKPISRVLF
jgi:hypothetical protein